MKSFTICLAIFFFIQSCATTTVITSNVPESEVYIGGEYKGKTPYYYKDMLPLGSHRKVQIKKEGYEVLETKIRKLDRLNGMAFFAGFVVLAPFLWSGTYDHYYQFDLIPEGQTSPLKSNYFEFGEKFLTKSGYKSIYLGEDNSRHYLFNQNNLHILDKKMNLLETVDLDIKLKGKPIDGFIENNEKKIVLLDYKTNEASILTIDRNNKTKENTLRKILYRADIIEEDYAQGYNRNKMTNKFICYTEKKLVQYNGNAKKEQEYSCSDGFIVEAVVLSNDRVLILEVRNNGEIDLVELKDGDSKSFLIENEDKKDLSFLRLSVNEENGKAYVSALIKGRHDNFNEAFVATIKVSELESTSYKIIDLKHSPSNKYLINRGIVSDDVNDILCLEKQNLILTTTTNTSTARSTTNQKTQTGSILLVSFAKEEIKQTWINRAIVSATHLEKLSSQFFLREGKLFCIYNIQINSRTILVQSIYDTDLNYLTVDFHDSYADEKVILHPSKYYETSDGDILFLMQYKTRLALAKANF